MQIKSTSTNQMLEKHQSECRGCGSMAIRPLLCIKDAPVNCSVLLRSPVEAQWVGKGDIRLAVCGSCGLISNSQFDPAVVTYNVNYENSLDASLTFRRYSEAAVSRLVEVHNLRHKRVIEIGCGKGRFLKAICAAGSNTGVGFDPGCDPTTATEAVRFVPDYYSEKYADMPADLVLCRHVLEHIPNPEVFLRSLRRSSGFHPDAVFYFEVPNTDWILDEMRIWDVIYPHCSYFTATTLTDLFRRCGFSVLRTGTGFSDQFLFIEALPKRAEDKVKVLPQHDTRFLANRTMRLRNGFDSTVGYWEQYLGERLAAGHRIAIWGAGAKAVMFLHLVPAARRAQALIDINPAKENTYIPGSCVLIQGPESLREVRPDLVVVLNPVYEAEVREMLASMDLPSEVMSVRDEALPRALRAPAGGAVS